MELIIANTRSLQVASRELIDYACGEDLSETSNLQKTVVGTLRLASSLSLLKQNNLSLEGRGDCLIATSRSQLQTILLLSLKIATLKSLPGSDMVVSLTAEDEASVAISFVSQDFSSLLVTVLEESLNHTLEEIGGSVTHSEGSLALSLKTT